MGFWFLDGYRRRKFTDVGAILDVMENEHQFELNEAFEEWLDENYTASQILEYSAEGKIPKEYAEEFETHILGTKPGEDIELGGIMFEWFDSMEELRSYDRKKLQRRSKDGSKSIFRFFKRK